MSFYIKSKKINSSSKSHTNDAFTLMELLLALSISGFIIIGMMQGFRSTQRILSQSRSALQINKAVCLLFNQIERDFNTAIIPIIAKIEKKEEKNKDGKETATKKVISLFFFAESAGEEAREKIGDKKYELFKQISFVNTNPLQVWGQKRSRLVRVGYELVKNKKQSTQEKISYDLYRKETADLKNQTFKEKEEMIAFPQKKELAISKHLVATNIKNMFVKYVMPKPKKKGERELISETEEEQLLELFSWGKTKETKNIVPQTVEIIITFWDATMEKEKMFSCTIPIFSYPTEKEVTKKTNNQQPDKMVQFKPRR